MGEEENKETSWIKPVLVTVSSGILVASLIGSFSMGLHHNSRIAVLEFECRNNSTHRIKDENKANIIFERLAKLESNQEHILTGLKEIKSKLP